MYNLSLPWPKKSAERTNKRINKPIFKGIEPAKKQETKNKRIKMVCIRFQESERPLI
jgi:hypothetical protein